MTPIATCTPRKSPEDRLEDAGLREIVSQMTCACAQSGAHADAPVARALFHRVDVLKQSPERAARSLGIAAGDALYLLAGIREDVAQDFVVFLGTGRVPAGTRIEKENRT